MVICDGGGWVSNCFGVEWDVRSSRWIGWCMIIWMMN